MKISKLKKYFEVKIPRGRASGNFQLLINDYWLLVTGYWLLIITASLPIHPAEHSPVPEEF